MMRTMRFVALVVIAFVAVLAAGRTLAATGDLWEVTSQMTMEGMPPGMTMPSQTRRVCAAKEWNKPPVAADERSQCEMVDFVTSASKSTWKMKCQGGVTGEGEITRTSPDAYAGWMKMVMPQGAMTMKLAGKKVDECDAAEAKKEREAQVARVEAQMAAGQKMAADATRQACAAPIESLNLGILNAQAATCVGPSYKTAFCDKAKTYDGFKLLCKRDPADTVNGPDSVAKYCAVDWDALTETWCGQAMKADDFDIIGHCCKTDAQGLAAEHCAGRAYTSVGGDKYQGFCVTFARDVMAGGSAAPPPAPKAKKSDKGGH